MIRFECKKCGYLVLAKKGSETATCQICGKTQRIPAVVIDLSPAPTRNDYDPQWNHYEQLLYKARTYRDIKILTETAEDFDRLGAYENSREMAEFCRRRIAVEQVRQKAEEEKRNIDEQRKTKARKIGHLRMAILNIAVVTLAIIITVITNTSIKAPSYDEAQSLMADGMYEEAISVFKKLGNYRDSEDLIELCRNLVLESEYNEAVTQMADGHYLFAQSKFQELSGYKDSDTLVIECSYQYALSLVADGIYNRAITEFEALGDYKDAAEQADAVRAKLGLSQ